MFEDTVKSIKAYLYDKTVSPLCGAFIVSWLLWNHRFVLAIIFGDGIQEKFSQMDLIIQSYSNLWILPGSLINFLLLPLIFSLIYIFVYPYPAKWIYTYSKKRQMELNKSKNDLEKQRLLTAEESRELIFKTSELEEKFQNENAKLKNNNKIITNQLDMERSEVTSLRRELGIKKINAQKLAESLAHMELELKELKGQHQEDASIDSSQTINPLSLESIDNDEFKNKVLLHIGEKQSIEESILAWLLNVETLSLGYILDRLAHNGLITYSSSDSNRKLYLTPAGRTYLIDNKLI